MPGPAAHRATGPRSHARPARPRPPAPPERTQHARYRGLAMSLRATLWALDHAPTTDPTETLVLVALADHADDDGRGCWPAHASIARRARCSVSTVQRTLTRLEQGGVIRRGQQGAVAHVRADRRPVVWDLVMPPRGTAGQSDRPVSEPSTAGQIGATTGQTGAHGRSRVTDEPSTNRRTEEPGSRPLSAQARATLARRAEAEQARARGAAAAARRLGERQTG